LQTRRSAEIAHEILQRCLCGEDWRQESYFQLLSACCGQGPDEARAASEALFGVLVEGLADRFEPRLSDTYAQLFAEAVAFAQPGWSAAELVKRYRRVRKTRVFDAKSGQIRTVFVLSRITLGADIAVTSLALDAAQRRFPSARVILVGSAKSHELFANDPRIGHIPVSYGRGGSLRDRLSVWPELQRCFSEPDSIVIDPDSRLTQLGLLPVCPEESYFFFESRAFGGDSNASLTELMRRWFGNVFGIDDAAPYVALEPPKDIPEGPVVTVSLGVGDNAAKRIPDPFEERLLAALRERGATVLVDKGAGNDEAERVERAVARAGAGANEIRTWEGAFADFASLISRSRLYVGYDSAGQHAAAACGTPLVSVFAGYPSLRMFERWRPTGRGPIEVVRVDERDPDAVLARALEAVDRLGVL